MSAKLKELQEKRAKLAAKIKELRDAYHAQDKTWKDDAQRQAWDEVNRDYDATMAELEAEQKRVDEASKIDQRFASIEEYERTSRHDRNGELPPGLEDTRGSRRIGDDGTPKITEETRALAFQAWFRRQFGEPLTKRHRLACRSVGLNPSRRSLDIVIPREHEVRQIQDEYRSNHPSKVKRALSALSLSGGGATVPQGFVNAFEANMLAFGGMLQVAEIMRTDNGQDMPWPTGDDTSNEGEIVGESSSQDGSTDPTFGAVVWYAHKFSSKMIKVPTELLEDSAFDLVRVLGEMIGERLGRAQNRKYTVGTGSGQPRGLVTDSSVGKTAASATAILFDEVFDLVHSVDPAYRNGARFMMHDNVILYLRKLKDGNGQYLWESGLKLGVPDLIAGYPYTPNQHMASSIASGAKTMLFGQLSKYKVRQVRGVRMKRMVERYADSDQEAFIAFLRADGKLLDAGTKPVKHLLHP